MRKCELKKAWRSQRSWQKKLIEAGGKALIDEAVKAVGKR
jgi:hypothetical protein